MMKLRDLVANSLPRVRGRKKKTTPVVGQPGTANEQNTAQHSLDKNANCFPPAYGSKFESRDAGAETYRISESSWRGNALYRGLEATRAEEFASRQAVNARGNGLVASHSAEGFSSHLVTSRSFDARMAVSDFNGSCSQMSSISETGAELYPNQYYHCHYHRHNHEHHYHQHHIHGTPMALLDQNQQTTGVREVTYLPSYGVEVSTKRDMGFFKKSFASFKSMRKCSRASKELVESSPGPDQSRCSVCPYPETVTFDRKSGDKRPTKPKRKGLKGFSKSKENKDVSKAKGDKSWFSDNDAGQAVTPPPPWQDAPSAYTTTERPRFRECSVESCVSRLYSGSREGSNVREIDVTGFDSASLSGYESDFPRSKVHRSRSRIKTNPWLPSPQPSGGRRSGNSDLRESKEDIASLDEATCRVPRSASFELQRSNTFMSASLPSWKDSGNLADVQRHRSLTPLDIKVTFGFNKSKAEEQVHVPPKLNDLNSERSSRPTSIVSPNTEFTMLADNLEQLASNISFEYEDMLDSTLESASVFHEDGQASIQELLTDEDVANSAKRKSGSGFLKSDPLAQQSAHSPDSGVGGLTSSDADDATVSPNAGTENMTLSSSHLIPVATSPSLDSRDFISNLSSNGASFCHDKNSLSLKVKPTALGFSTSTNHTEINRIEDSAVSESDIDNTNYDSADSHVKKLGSPLLRCKTDGQRQNTSLMVNERLDIRFSPAHRHVLGTGVFVGSRHHNEFHVKMSNGMPSNRFSDPTDGTPRRLRRPSFLTPSHTTQLNDIEKCSALQLSNLTDAFPFPKNISASECIESPTENNWQWDGHWEGSGRLSMQGSEDAIVPDQVAIGQSNEKSLILGTDLIQSSQCISNKPSESDTKSIASGVLDMTSEVSSLMDCIMDRVDNRPHDLSFEMSDASVQTDFDDDFSMWEEADSFEHFRSIPPETSENTRLWLLTGNMQDSADTGYSSLTRDSQILIDEDTLFLAGESEKRKSADMLCSSDWPQRLLSSSRSPRNSLLFDTQHDINRRSGSFRSEQAGRIPSDVVTDTDVPPKIKPIRPQKSGHPRAIPQETVNEMFSSIELQFQEIFQQIHQHEKNSTLQKQLSSKHMKSSAREIAGTITETKGAVLTDAETGENKDFANAHDKEKVFKCDRLRTQKDKMGTADVTPNETKVKTDTFPALIATGQKVDNQDICEKEFRKLERLQEKADYLEFLKDVPLRRSHLKRPLFLVPGVGPVDMSHAEHLNMFSEIDAPAPAPSLSPVVKHAGKKQKFKKGHVQDGGHRLTPDQVKADELLGVSRFPTNTKDCFSTPGPSIRPCGGSQMNGVINSQQTFHKDSIPRLRTSCQAQSSVKIAQDPTKSSPPQKDPLQTNDLSAHNLSGMRNLAAKVMSLRQEKELVFRKIQEAQKDEVCRQEQRSLLERSLHAKRKEALLDNLRDLRSKLEEQSRKLRP